MWLTCVISRLVRENQGNCYQNNYIQGHQNNDLGAPRDLETFLALPLMPSGMWPSQIISLCLRPFLFGYQKYTYLIKWSKKLFYFCLHWKSLSSTGNKFEDLVKLTFGLKWIWSYYPWEKAYSWWIFDLDNSAFGLDPGEWLKFLLKFVQVAQWVRLFCAMLLLKEEIFTVERCLSFFCAASSAIKLHHVS